MYGSGLNLKLALQIKFSINHVDCFFFLSKNNHVDCYVTRSKFSFTWLKRLSQTCSFKVTTISRSLNLADTIDALIRILLCLICFPFGLVCVCFFYVSIFVFLLSCSKIRHGWCNRQDDSLWRLCWLLQGDEHKNCSKCSCSSCSIHG